MIYNFSIFHDWKFETLKFPSSFPLSSRSLANASQTFPKSCLNVLELAVLSYADGIPGSRNELNPGILSLLMVKIASSGPSLLLFNAGRNGLGRANSAKKKKKEKMEF